MLHSSPCKLFLTVLVMLQPVKSLLLTEKWNRDVYTGRHFDEVMAENSNVTGSCVLLMYTPTCDAPLRIERFSNKLPPSYALHFAKYDYATTPSYVWYYLDKRDDLYLRYKPTHCLEMLHFKNCTVSEAPERIPLNATVDLIQTLWDLIGNNVTIRNNYRRPVMIEIETYNKIVKGIELPHNATYNATVYNTQNIIIRHTRNQKILQAHVVDEHMNGTKIIVERSNSSTYLDEPDWRNSITNSYTVSKNLDNRASTIAQQYLFDLKQPSVVPIFTNDGFKKQVIPDYIYDPLLEHYTAKRSDTKLLRGLGKKDFYNLPLDQLFKAKMAPFVRVMVENWCDVGLDLTRISEFRESGNGNTEPSHLANLANQVFACLMVLKCDHGTDTWPLEVVGYDGIRSNVTLNEHEMLFYESSSVMVGRPYPFKGQLCVTVTMYYRPAEDWKWSLSQDRKHFLFGTEIKESAHVLATMRTLRRAAMRGMRDEL